MNLNQFKKLKSPYILILVGPPLVGKSFFCYRFTEEIDNDVIIISRDECVMDVYGSRNYSEAFKNVNQKDVDRLLDVRMTDASKSGKNVIVDMTNMTSKRRRQNLRYFKDYYKVAVIFEIPNDEELIRRNNKRVKEENKNLPMFIVKNMIKSYQTIDPDEGFNKVVSLK